jgi:signal transduction histidine kinase/ligand-binding sensor domain-containing protein
MLVAFSALVPTSVRALDTDRSLRQFHHTAWTRAQGAPSQISALAQTRDGFLWMGSTQGLYWFDGMRFRRFEPVNDVQVPSHNSYALHPTADGGLWVSFRPSGLGFIRDGRLTLYTRPDQIPRTQVYAFATAADGRLFAGTHEGIAEWNGTRWNMLDASWGAPPDRVRQLVAMTRGLAAVVGREVLLLAPNASRFAKIADIPSEPVEMVADPGGTIWVSCEDGMLRVPASGPPVFERETSHPPFVEILFDRNGALWLGNDFGLQRIRDDPARTKPATTAHDADSFTDDDGLTGDNIIHLLEDREGNVWVATARGLDRFRANPVVPVALPEGYASNTIAAGEDGTIWVAGMFTAPLLRVDAAHRAGARTPLESASAPVQARSVIRTRDGTTWWGGLGTMYRQRGREIDVLRGPQAIADAWIWDLSPAPDGAGLWLGVDDHGVWQVRDDAWSPAQLPDGLLPRVPSASFDDGAGVQWFGYTGNRVLVVDHGRVTAYGPEDGLDIGRVKVIRGNAVQRWVGGELGVAFFDGKRFHRVRFAGTQQPGAVGGIVSTKSGDVWLSEMRSLVRIPVDEMRSLLRDPDHPVRAQWFDEGDGLPGAPQMNTTDSTALEASDGMLWFVTDSGLAWVDPAKLHPAGPNPAARLLTVRARDEPIDAKGAATFPVGTDHLEFAFTAMTLTAPERIRFRYRLDGFDNVWQDSGTERDALYSRVPPGDYVFRVQAAHPGQAWDGPEASMAVSIAPAFWQTRWFLFLCIALAATIVGALYLLRLHQMERQMLERLQERHDERERIARELHDTLLQGLHGLILRFHAIAVQIPADNPLRASIDRALDRADDMLVESRDRVTNMRTSTETAVSLPLALTHAGQQFAEGYPGQFVHAVEGVACTIDPIVQDDLYQLGREALFNAFNHSDASRIELLMVFEQDRFVLRVTDNGRGLPPEVARTGGLHGHWGLAGMRERAERVQGALSIGSGADGGTTIELVVPARTAYAVSAARRFRDWALRRATIATSRD